MDWASEAAMFDFLSVNPMTLPLCWFKSGGPSSETSVRFIPCKTKGSFNHLHKPKSATNNNWWIDRLPGKKTQEQHQCL